MTTYDGVYCKDLYADQIEAERNGTSSNQDFTRAFADYYTEPMICPNTTNVTINIDRKLAVKILPCGKAKGAAYAKDTSCVPDAEQSDLLSF